MSLSISNIVDIQLNTVPKAASRKDFGTVALFTPETGNAFADGTTRYVYVSDYSEVVNLFGSTSETAKAAQPFFAQQPRAKQLIICRWQKESRQINPTSNGLNGGVMSATLEEFKQIQSGYFSLTVGETHYDVTGLDLQDATDFDSIATKIQEKFTAVSLTNVTINYDETGNRFLLASTNSGQDKSNLIFYAEDSKKDGEYLGSMLKLEDGQASRKIGQNGLYIEAESPVEALIATLDVNSSWYGVLFAAQLTDDQIIAVANWSQTAKKLFGLNVLRDDQLEWNSTNVIKKLYDAGLDHTLAVYDKNDSYPVSSAMARLLSVNFSANRSTITLKFKTQPTITADDITATEYQKAKRLGVNVYTYFDDSAMLAEGTVVGGKFADEVVILDWFADAVQKEVFSRLYLSPTKIPLTDEGQVILMAAVEKVCLEGINNGAFAKGVWTGDSFGNLVTGDTLEQGYYIYAAPMSTLSTSDREQRKATPIQVAVKLAGAIHSSDVIINFSR
ncbi:DUF3383 domain-containing protein [Lonepinella koalarum]|uniref:DUF3383 domain-containing protein n=1 Tax=Lonepinella koalarum TaxID=53417 RepID=UPI003F6E0C8C